MKIAMECVDLNVGVGVGSVTVTVVGTKVVTIMIHAVEQDFFRQDVCFRLVLNAMSLFHADSIISCYGFGLVLCWAFIMHSATFIAV